MLTGRLITESLLVGIELEVPDLRAVRVGRHDVSVSTAPGDAGGDAAEAGGAAPGQPAVWTFLDFEAPEHRADELAAALARCLDPVTGWYADFAVGDDHVVVFANKVFRYRTGEPRGREEAVAWGIAAGTPAHQLDWGE